MEDMNVFVYMCLHLKNAGPTVRVNCEGVLGKAVLGGKILLN